MANRNVKDFPAVNSINLSAGSILTIVAGELKRFTGQTITIDSSGRVGIGTSSPNTKVEVNGSVRVGSGNDYQFDATLKMNAESTGATGYLRFFTNSIERLRIDGGGYVGVGTAAPVSIFEVSHASADYIQGLIITNTNTNYGSRLLFRSPLNTGTTISAASISQGYDTTGRGNLVLSVATSSTLTERLRIAGSGNLYITGTLSSSDKIGYGNVSETGVGGTITQLTNKSTGVTLNKICGQIVTNNAALAAAAEVSFILTNSYITATDIVNVCIAAGATAGAYNVHVDAVSAGSCRIAITNLSAGSLSEALTINFAIFKSVNA